MPGKFFRESSVCYIALEHSQDFFVYIQNKTNSRFGISFSFVA